MKIIGLHHLVRGSVENRNNPPSHPTFTTLPLPTLLKLFQQNIKCVLRVGNSFVNVYKTGSGVVDIVL